MSWPACVQDHPSGVYLSIKLQPRASKNEISGEAGGELKIKVTAPPVDSAANEALVRLLAAALDCPRGAVALVRGTTSRHKQVLVTGEDATSVVMKLKLGPA